jgi:hypothetical protein
MRTLLKIFIPLSLLVLGLYLIPQDSQRPLRGGVPFPEDTGTPGNSTPAPYIFSIANESARVSPIRQGTDRQVGQAWGDYDQDGWFDLYVTDPRGPNLLYRNRGDGTFELPAAADDVSLPNANSAGAIFADYDNDGFPDLYVVNRNQPNVLFHNEGGAGFVDVSDAAGVADPLDGKSASWGDYDGDGWLDLYVANWACYPDCARSQFGDRDALYHNNGNGTFTNVTHLLGSKVDGAGFVASFVDFDNDSDPDIYLINDVFINDAGNALWRNDGPGCDGWCFTEMSAQAGADTRLMGMGLATSDYDNDGDFDFYFSNSGPMVLLQNQGDGTFRDVALDAGLDYGLIASAWGTVSFDYDADGWQDFYLAVSDQQTEPPANPLFHNRGDGTFDNMGDQISPAEPARSLGVAYADYDRDGWLDLVIGDYEKGYTLLRNESGRASANHRIALRLVGGHGINRDAVGTRVTITTADGRAQMQELQFGSSLGAGNAAELYFGLGNSAVTSLVIRWPNGVTETYDSAVPDRLYVIAYRGAAGPAPANPRWLLPALLVCLSLPLALTLRRRAS